MNRFGVVSLLIFAFALAFPATDAAATGAGEADWVIYAQEANGDVYVYDASRLERVGALRRVWSGVRYKNSVMGAASFLSLLEIDCAARTEQVLQSTFFIDRNWERPAMKTDRNAKPARAIGDWSVSDRLADILCN